MTAHRRHRWVWVVAFISVASYQSRSGAEPSPKEPSAEAAEEAPAEAPDEPPTESVEEAPAEATKEPSAEALMAPPGVCPEAPGPRRNCRQGIDVTEYKNLLLLNFGSTLAGRIELEYERALHRRVSVFGAAYVVAFDSLGNERLVGFGALVGPRVYMVGGAPEGLWLAWQLGGVYRNPRGNREVQLRAFQTGAMLGWTWVWRRLAATAGGGFNYTTGRVSVDSQSVRGQEWNPWFKVGLGVAF